MSAAVFAFAGQMAQAGRLAQRCGVPLHPVTVRRFPDGESLVTAQAHGARTALLLRSLDDPNAKLVELLLASAALRDGGASRVILIAPYLAYMRQDIAFHPGEAISQRVIGQLLAQWFDGVVTVDPHLHRIERLDQAIPGIPALALSAAPALIAAIRRGLDPRTVLVGPDSESRPWAQSIAVPLGLDMLVGEKVRHGDRAVTLEIPGIEQVAGRPVLLVDDLISSGTTLVACAALLQAAGAGKIEAVATHVLASPDDMAQMAAAGITRIRATDAAAHPAATIPLAGVLADAIRAADWLD
ncbi:ribose-phosphate diphosphokinase [Novosphingobium sp.]|uniref:ribose-phosphate diphosphokinase n=1 Tax=Novosphingobium sp. TaxID=1874826 RepID=UPI0027334C33|nr:ribose-phosphate diphosphokinase [Novosphingobium sp.]MDP3907810.1 ribose-phosphate diphosphokinase [Novosphingobium sp.]